MIKLLTPNFRLRTPNSELRTNISSSGFTLIEIIVVIVMAGILLPAIVVPFVTGVRGSGKPEMVNKSMYLAHQKMEEFMKFDYANVSVTTLTPYVPSDITTYQWQWEIVYVDSNFNASGTDVGYKRILVRVRDPENDTYEVTSVVTSFP